MNEIAVAIDSLVHHADSVGRAMHTEIMNTTYKSPITNRADSLKLVEQHLTVINTDSIYNAMASDERLKTVSTTGNRVSSLASDWSMKSFMTQTTDDDIRSHRSDWHKKITLSLACICFFFIGAPLGAIIRKGGLGMPVVLSVLIFVVYYIIDSGATRVAKSGEMNIVLGTWMSTIVLAPLGAFFTYKSNKDSVVFNIDVYVAFFRKILGIRQSRHIFKKEVIIHSPNYAKNREVLAQISLACQNYLDTHRLEECAQLYSDLYQQQARRCRGRHQSAAGNRHRRVVQLERRDSAQRHEQLSVPFHQGPQEPVRQPLAEPAFRNHPAGGTGGVFQYLEIPSPP